MKRSSRSASGASSPAGPSTQSVKAIVPPGRASVSEDERDALVESFGPANFASSLDDLLGRVDADHLLHAAEAHECPHSGSCVAAEIDPDHAVANSGPRG